MVESLLNMSRKLGNYIQQENLRHAEEVKEAKL